MRVLVIANNLQQASYRLRVEALRNELGRRGVELDVQLRPRGILARRRLLLSASAYDAVILQRKLLDLMDARLLRRRATKIFYDVDDAVMYHNRPVNLLARWRTWRRFRATAAHVDLVVAGNDYLAQLFRRRGSPATVIPTVVDIDRYRAKSHGPTDSPSLIWIGSRSTLAYLAALLPALKTAAQHVPGLRLITVADATLPDCPIPLRHIPWSAETEADALSLGDIGIAPTPLDRWTLGKCGFKILQYMAAGLPVIASPVGVNAQIVMADETGLLPAGWSDWPAAILALCREVELRRSMGVAGRQRVQDRYTIQAAAATWEALLLRPLASATVAKSLS